MAKQECSICGEEYRGFGNNADPINNGRCCDICDDIKVIPARLKKAGFTLKVGGKIKSNNHNDD